MNKKLYLVLTVLVCILGWISFFSQSMAMEREETGQNTEQDGYITISVDAEDDNGELTYAIDSDAPEAFGLSNIFLIDPTMPHTIYVKDIAGNITSQSFQPIGLEYSKAEEAQQTQPQSSGNHDNSAAEDGGGSVYDKTVTDGTDDFRRVFYTLTTKEGEVFYLVIDQNRGQDNVYLLNMVTVDELQALASSNGYILSDKRNESLGNLNDLSGKETIEDLTGNSAQDTKKKSSNTNTSSTIVILVVAVIGGGIYYYLKVIKKKKDAAMDEIDQALDMEAFVSDDHEGDEIDMPVDKTISDDEFYNDMYGEEEIAYLDMDPDEEEGND